MRRSLAPLLLLPTVALIMTLSTLACAPATSASGGAAQSSRSTAISGEQARETGAANAYDVVQSLRPTWLRVRGSQSVNSPVGIVVYLDETRMGGLETLRQISSTTVASIEFVEPSAAQFRWGSGHAQGVILVKTRGR